MATNFLPHWEKHPFESPRGPESWVFYVVANINRQPRPLAVIHRHVNTAAEHEKGRDIARQCLRLLTVLSDPTNRTAIEAEVALAVEFYQQPEESLLPPVPLPEPYWVRRPYSHRRKNVADYDIPEFPFISTCAMVGASWGYPNWYPEGGPLPLRTVWNDADKVHGMVIADITDLDNVRYGIVCFPIWPMVWLGSPSTPLDDETGVNIVWTFEEDRSRKPLSIGQYTTLFDYAVTEDVQQLGQMRIIGHTTMDCVWPTASLRHIDELPIKFRQQPNSLFDQAIRILINSTLEVKEFPASIFDAPRKLPHFQGRLLQLLQERSGGLGKHQSAGKLIALCFEGKTHLDLLRMKGLSAETIGHALQADELKYVKSISICLHTVHSPPAQLAEDLSESTSLRDLYFLDEPNRASDTLSTDLFLELSKRPRLLRGKLVIAGAYSSPLRNRLWLPTVDYQPDWEIFPVQQMFFLFSI